MLKGRLPMPFKHLIKIAGGSLDLGRRVQFATATATKTDTPTSIAEDAKKQTVTGNNDSLVG